MTMRNFIIMILMSVCFYGCDNWLAKSYGGSMTVELPPCRKLIVATWKDSDLWYLTRPWREGDVAENPLFQEESALGIAEGTVTFHETCPR